MTGATGVTPTTVTAGPEDVSVAPIDAVVQTGSGAVAVCAVRKTPAAADTGKLSMAAAVQRALTTCWPSAIRWYSESETF